MGFGLSKEEVADGILEDILKEPEDEEIVISWSIKDYPPPRPPNDKKKTIFTTADMEYVDGRAKEVKVEDVETVDQLVSKLTKGFKKDVQKVRAIFVWIGTQKLEKLPNKKTEVKDTPLELLHRVKLRKLSYTVLFTMLCRAANIPCVIIRGKAKSVAYEVGDKSLNGLLNVWNAVHVAGGWRFVFPLWAFRAIVGHNTGKWTLVETEGKGVREKQETSTGLTISHINENCFLTDPEQFIYTSFPDNVEWQLLKKSWSEEDFVTRPFCRPAFFENNFKITSEFKCLLHAKNGKCEISLQQDTKNEKTKLFLQYQLFFNHEESKKPLPKETEIRQYVAKTNEHTSTKFVVRFPAEGIYKMEIFCEKRDSFPLLCTFKLVCDKKADDSQPYPCNPDIGFGPCETTALAGLIPVTHKTGFINYGTMKNVIVTFQLKQEVSVKITLENSHFSAQQLQDCVTYQIKKRELEISTTLPQSEEYALRIDTRRKGSNSAPFRNACNYLLSPEKVPKKRDYENAREKKAREELNNCVNCNDPDVIQKAMEMFKTCELDDYGQMEKAQDRMEFILLKQGLKEGINRNNIEVLENSIQKAESSKMSKRLQNLIDDAKGNLADLLQKSKKYAHDNLDMKQGTVMEICGYSSPPQIVCDVMKATFLLLGESQEDLQEWDFIQSRMRGVGKRGFLSRIKRFDKSNMDKGAMKDAADCIKPYDMEMASTASAGIGTFYEWIQNVLRET